jgi:hypothetical protein
MKMAAGSFEMSVNFYKTMWLDIPENSIFRRSCEQQPQMAVKLSLNLLTL